MKVDVEQFKLRDKEKAEQIKEQIQSYDPDITLMHVCGTHQDSLVRFGLEEIFRDLGVDIRQGPGCPVCVTTPDEIEEIIRLAEEGITVTAFGDMVDVPGDHHSLSDARNQGADIQIVYGVDDAVKIAVRQEEPVVFMSVGFETTTPSIAATIASDPPDNFYILTCNRVIPPALKAILDIGEIGLDGLIQPGHVSTIIGTEPYEPFSKDYCIPQVVAGFEPLDLLLAVLMLIKQKREGRAEVENEYDRVVKKEGNVRAKKVTEQVFEPKDIDWRGFPVIPDSGLKLKDDFKEHSARDRFEDLLEPVWEQEFEEPEGCLCGEVLRGLVRPNKCSQFGEKCTPPHPVGPCMVSREGSCNIAFRYRAKN